MEDYLTQITNYLLTQSWQIAILVAAVAAVSWLLRNKSAHVRYLLWLIVLAKCLVPPLVTVPLAVLPQERPVLLLETPPPVISEPVASPPVPDARPAAPSVAQVRTRLNVRPLLGIGWITGVSAFVLVAMTKALQTISWLRRERKPLPAELQTTIEELFSELGTLPKLWLIDGIGQPFVWGLLRGSIYLPANFVKVGDAEHRRGILGHELSHILRFDAAVNLLQVMAQAIFWFHPFVWWANKRIRAERERCCDEMAIARLGAKAKEYSSAIVNILIAEQESTRSVPTLAVAGPVKNIEERIKTMLRPGKKFYKRPSLIAATIVLLLALLTVPTALVLTARAETKPTGEQKPEPAKSLHQAAADGDIEQVKLLISKGADVHARDGTGKTPLHLAANSGQTEVAELLIAKGADIHSTDNQGGTPLVLAAYEGRRNTVGLLVSKGADIEHRNIWGNTPLSEGAYRGKLDVASFLLTKGAQVDAKNYYDQTPLHRAIESGFKEMAELLLANGADIRAKHYEWTAIGGAMRNDLKEMVKFLMGKGVDFSPVHVAAYFGEIAEIKNYLAKGGDINKQDPSGLTLLACAICGGQTAVLEFLLNQGADVNLKGGFGMTALHWASVVPRPEAVKLLLDKGADVGLRDKTGCTALHRAAYNAPAETVEMLIKKGSDVNAKSDIVETKGSKDSGWTPLHNACGAGKVSIAELLIANGGDIRAKTQKGETALSLARKMYEIKGDIAYKQTTEFLRKHGAKE